MQNNAQKINKLKLCYSILFSSIFHVFVVTWICKSCLSLTGACIVSEEWWDYLLHGFDLHLHPGAWPPRPLPGSGPNHSAGRVQSGLYLHSQLQQPLIVPCPVSVHRPENSLTNHVIFLYSVSVVLCPHCDWWLSQEVRAHTEAGLLITPWCLILWHVLSSKRGHWNYIFSRVIFLISVITTPCNVLI